MVGGETQMAVLETDGTIISFAVGKMAMVLFKPDRDGGCGWVSADGHHITGQPFAMIYDPAQTKAEVVRREDRKQAVRFAPR